jgi:dihydrofolate reductase
MRKIIVLSMITLDGVMQAPGGPEEDTSGGFQYGGWVAPYGDEVSGKVMEKLMQPADLLLGRKTFEIWEHYWPEHADNWPGINDVTKYVLSTTMKKSDWKNSVFLNSLADIEKLKKSNGSDIQVWGSGELVQLLLKHDLVDELWLMIHPLTLGKGKKLFASGPIPAAFTLIECTVTPSGVIIAHYKRAGEVKTGTVGP